MNKKKFAIVGAVCLMVGCSSDTDTLTEFSTTMQSFATFAQQNNLDHIIDLPTIIFEANEIIDTKDTDKVERFLWEIEKIEEECNELIATQNEYKFLAQHYNEKWNNLDAYDFTFDSLMQEVTTSIDYYEFAGVEMQLAQLETIYQQYYLGVEDRAVEVSAVLDVQQGVATYILPHSNTQYLTIADISHLSSTQLRIARNEIYARHGRMFNSSDLQTYFNSQSWYSGTISAESFSDSTLSDIEKTNVELISNYESSLSGGSSSSSTSTSSSTSSSTTAYRNTYILSNSNTKYLSNSDISHLSDANLRIARNEIYARHGRMFDSSDLQTYFDSQIWYNGTVSASKFSDSVLSNIEKANVELISAYETARANGTASTSTTTYSSSSSSYMLSNSNTKYLAYSDISHLTSAQLRIARNEIYARHGRMFASSDLQEYFNSKSWYRGTISAENFSESVLSDIEKANIAFISQYE
ncbi:MAG: hypothetical protein ATN35_08790 [Epulopiscium sp. Nele67-Bin004]|nr:MAG: hypothetical protein ATN35_08790 [Epulopiscium sp. Nele67-Bin004]